MRQFETLEERQFLTAVAFSNEREIGQIGDNEVVSLVDMDGDSDFDVLTPHEWFENDNSAFAARHQWNPRTFRFQGERVNSGDFANSGFPQIVHGGSGFAGRVRIFDSEILTQEFQLSQWIDEGEDEGGASTIVPVDIDGDGDLDILVSNIDAAGDRSVGFVAWFENQRGQFTQRHEVTTDAGRILTMRIGDLDGDLDVDIVASDGHWFENNGGSFERHQYFDAQRTIRAVGVGDIDRDGDSDLLILDALNNGEILWLENLDGHGTFSVPIVVEEVPNLWGGSLEDIDSDGDLDIIAWVARGNGAGTESQFIWYRNEDGKFHAQAELLSISGFIIDAHFSDLDNDNDRDLVVVGGLRDGINPNRVHWFENTIDRILGDVNCDGVFDSTDLLRIFVTGEYEDGIENNSTYDEGDFNGDGDFDSSDFVYVLAFGKYQQSRIFAYGYYFENTDEDTKSFGRRVGNTDLRMNEQPDKRK